MTEVTFDDLTDILSENQEYTLNEKGRNLIKFLRDEYDKLALEYIYPGVSKISNKNNKVKDICKQVALFCIQELNAQQSGNEKFTMAIRLSNIFNDGKNTINDGEISLNPDDEIFEYIEKI